MKKTLLIVAGVTLCAMASQAAFLTADCATRKVSPRQWADANLKTRSAPSGHGQTSLRAYPVSRNIFASPIFVFVLPDIKGKTISEASLSIYGKPNMPDNIYNSALDLYAIRYVARSGSKADTEVLASDEASRPAYSKTGNNGRGIMNNFFPKSHASAQPGLRTTDAEAGRNLGAWLQAQYKAGAKAGDYVFFRLTPDSPASPGMYSHGWVVTARDDVSNPAHQPVLTITTGESSSKSSSKTVSSKKPKQTKRAKTSRVGAKEGAAGLLGLGFLTLVLLRCSK